MGIYDIFRMAAETVERVPWRWKVLNGAAVGGLIGATSKDPNETFNEKVSKGLLLGTGLALGAGMLLRGAGTLAEGGNSLWQKIITSKLNQVKTEGFRAFMKPGSLMVGGAIAGSIIAPEGHRTQGAMLGAAGGLAFLPAKKLFSAYSQLGKVPGLQTAALMSVAAGGVAASAVFGKGDPSAEGVAVPGVGGLMDYNTRSSNMQDRMIAMNANGDIVLGLHSRQHG